MVYGYGYGRGRGRKGREGTGERNLTKTSRLLGLILAMLIITASTLISPRAVRDGPGSPERTGAQRQGRLVLPLVVRAPWILNGEFELSTTDGSCHWYDWTGGNSSSRWHCPQEVRVPALWRAGWHNQLRDGFEPTGQPEMRLTDPVTDPGRSRSGRAVMWFTFWRRQWVWIQQQVPLAFVGRYVTARSYVQVWDSQCSTRPFDPPLDQGCRKRIQDNLVVRLCLDSPVQELCTAWHSAYCHGDPCWHRLEVGPYKVASIGALVRIEAWSRLAYKHQNVYVDDVTVWLVSSGSW